MADMLDNEQEPEKRYLVGDIKIDGIEPTPEFLEYAEKERRGELTPDDISKFERYKMIEGAGE